MYVDPRWVIVVLGSAAAFGSLSPLVYARRFSFFAASLPHSALLSVTLGYVLSLSAGGHPAAWAVALSLPPSALLIYFLHSGVSVDSATSAFVSFSVAGSVAAMYYVLTNYPARVSLWSYILGDPLLAGWDDALLVVAVAVPTCALAAYTYMEEMSIGLDAESAAASGVRVRLHDYLLALLLTVVAVSLLKAVGFTIEHVVMLLPGAIAARLARSARAFFALSLASSLASGAAGLALSLMVNLAPAAAIGFVLLAIYVASLLAGGGR